MAQNIQKKSIAISASGDNTVIAADANSVYHIHYIELQNSSVTQTTAILKDGSTAFNGSGYVLNTLDMYTFGTPDSTIQSEQRIRRDIPLTKGNAFIINLSGANAHNGFVLYSVEGV